MSLRAISIAALVAACLGGAASAQPVGLEGAPAMSREELSETRGAVLLPNGFELGFGALVSTFVDGELALQTQLTWTEQGPQTELLAGAYTPDLGGAAAQKGLTVGGQFQGLLSPGADGATVIVHDLTDGRIGNLVLNNASGRDIRQSAEITLNVPQLDVMQRQIAQQSQLRQLQNSLGFALRDAAQ